MLRIAGILLLAFLQACSSNETSIEPSPLPQFKSQINIQRLWERRVGEGVEDQYLSLKPVVNAGGFYAASAAGLVIKLDPETGKSIWHRSLEREISGGLALGNGLVGLGSSNGELILLEQETGNTRWEKSLSGQIMSVPVITDSRVLVQTLDGRLHCLDLENGATIWLFDTNIPALTLRGESSPVVYGQAALAGFANGKLVALDVDSGAVAWENAVGEPSGRSELERLTDLDGTFTVVGKTVYAVSFQGNLMAIDLPSGRILWTRELSSYLGVVSSLGQLYTIDEDSVVASLDTLTGSDVWQQDKLKGRRLGVPAVYDRYVLVTDFEGFMYWLSYRDGSFLARVKVGHKTYELANKKAQSLRNVTDPSDGIRAQPVVFNDVVYVQSNNGDLVAYRVVTEK